MNISSRPGYPIRINNEPVKVSTGTPVRPNQVVVRGNVMYLPDTEAILREVWPKC